MQWMRKILYNTNNNIVTVFDLTSFSAQVELIISDMELPYVIKDKVFSHTECMDTERNSPQLLDMSRIRAFMTLLPTEIRQKMYSEQ